ncbi:hypothetical protein RND81_12G207300 [Saponaria officinalis]|uniref:Reverse transcriptase domain-containing protein n=1 Tax=Saponaria officinalis TaxID=3572 RepID=A0AAW1HDE5_SAPOF
MCDHGVLGSHYKWSTIEYFCTRERIATRRLAFSLLFIMCAEAFSSLIARGVARRSEGIRVCRNAPFISHLFFADDTIIFSKADGNNAMAIYDAINTYEQASGQRINLSKSELLFSPNVALAKCDQVGTILEAKVVNAPSKYLGMPAIIGKNKTLAFAPLRERVWKKIKGWERKVFILYG